MASPRPATPKPRRIAIDERRFYELTVFDPLGVALYVSEVGHDATLQLTPQQIVELRGELATALLKLGHAPSLSMSEDAAAAMEHFRRGFQLLVEVDKRSPAEVDLVIGSTLSTIRNWRPQALVALQEGL